MSVSDNIRAIRIAKGLSQAEVARRYGTSPEFYHRLEKKKNQSISWDQLLKVADALGVSYKELIGSEDSTTSPSIADLQTKIISLESDNERLTNENRELKKEQDRLNETLGFVKSVMDFAKANSQQVAEIENDLFGGDSKKKERTKKRVVDTLNKSAKDTK